jgi:hypothetical protein
VPAAAVIPAPIAYIKVVAVKKLVVGSRERAGGPPRGGLLPRLLALLPRLSLGALRWVPWVAGTFTLKKLECSKQALQPE